MLISGILSKNLHIFRNHLHQRTDGRLSSISASEVGRKSSLLLVSSHTKITEAGGSQDLQASYHGDCVLFVSKPPHLAWYMAENTHVMVTHLFTGWEKRIVTLYSKKRNPSGFN